MATDSEVFTFNHFAQKKVLSFVLLAFLLRGFVIFCNVPLGLTGHRLSMKILGMYGLCRKFCSTTSKFCQNLAKYGYSVRVAGGYW